MFGANGFVIVPAEIGKLSKPADRNRRFSKDYEYRVQTSETMLDIAATRLMLNRLASA